MFGYTACVCVCNLYNFNYFLSLSLNISFTTSMWSIWESLADVLHQQRSHANTQRAWSQYATSWRKFTSSICLPLFGRGTACTHIFMFMFLFLPSNYLFSIESFESFLAHIRTLPHCMQLKVVATMFWVHSKWMLCFRCRKHRSLFGTPCRMFHRHSTMLHS